MLARASQAASAAARNPAASFPSLSAPRADAHSCVAAAASSTRRRIPTDIALHGRRPPRRLDPRLHTILIRIADIARPPQMRFQRAPRYSYWYFRISTIVLCQYHNRTCSPDPRTTLVTNGALALHCHAHVLVIAPNYQQSSCAGGCVQNPVSC